MRSYIAWLACAACSVADTNVTPLPTSLHRDCEPPVAQACAALAIVTPRDAMPPSSMPYGQELTRRSGVEAFEYPSLLQRFAIDGLPPRFHATTNALIVPSPSGVALATDGENLFATALENKEVHFQSWGPTNQLLADVTLSSSKYAYSVVAAYQGLALLPMDSLLIVDLTGTTVWSQPRSTFGTPSAYGCGFALWGQENYPDATLTTIPLDGRAEQSQPAPVSSPVPWPYDAHAVAFTTHLSPNGYDLNAACITAIDVLFDDGRAPMHEEVTALCGAGDATILSTSLGAILEWSNSDLVLLDANAAPAGPVVVTIPQDAQPANRVVVPIGNYVAVLTADWSPTEESYTYWETIVSCSD